MILNLMISPVYYDMLAAVPDEFAVFWAHGHLCGLPDISCVILSVQRTCNLLVTWSWRSLVILKVLFVLAVSQLQAESVWLAII